MKNRALGLTALTTLTLSTPSIAANKVGSAWANVSGDLIFAAGAIILALVLLYWWRGNKSKKQAAIMTSQPATEIAATTRNGVTITPATSKPKHGTEGVCCGSCSD